MTDRQAKNYSLEDMETFCALAASKAMEWAANVCEKQAKIGYDGHGRYYEMGAMDCAKAIRAAEDQSTTEDARPELASLAQMVCDPENQPHQYVGDPEGFAMALQEAKPEAPLTAEYDPVSQKCRGDCNCSVGQTCRAYLVYKYKAISQPQGER